MQNLSWRGVNALRIYNATGINALFPGSHGVFVVLAFVSEDFTPHQARIRLEIAELFVLKRGFFFELNVELGLRITGLPEHLLVQSLEDSERLRLPIDLSIFIDGNDHRNHSSHF